MLALLIDFTVNVVIYFVGIGIVGSLLNLLARKPISALPWLKILGGAVAISLFALIPRLTARNQPSAYVGNGLLVTSRDSLTASERDVITRVYKLVFNVNDTIDASSHANFWAIVNKHGGNPGDIDGLEDKAEMTATVADGMSNYLRFFYRDALVALKTGKPFMSAERRGWSNRMSEDRLAKNEELMARIIAKKPVPIQGVNTVLDRPTITEILKNLDLMVDLTQQKVDILYDKAYFASKKP